MTTIADIFDWDLEKIFQELPRKDRLVCKQVCKRWFNILMSRTIFLDDRHIFFTTNNIRNGDGPTSILMQAKKPYQKYTIVTFDNEINQSLLRFIECVGVHIEYFELKGIDEEVPKLSADFLALMPSLKCLKIPYFNARYVKENIRKCLPQNCTITIKNGIARNIEEFNELNELVQKMYKFNFIVDRQQEMEKLLEVNELTCDIFALHCRLEHHPFDAFAFLEALQSKHQNLKEIELNSYWLPPVNVNLPKMTSLVVDLRERENINESLKSLEKLTNLKKLSLEFDFAGSSCEFGHEILSLPKLKIFHIYLESYCEECMRAFLNSFDNLTEFELLIMESFTWNQFKSVVNVNLSNSLEKLSIREIVYINEDIMIEMSELFPKLKELKIYYSFYSLNLMKEMLTVITKRTKVTKLRLHIFFADYKKNWNTEFDIICDYLEKLGFPVEDKNAAKGLCKKSADVIFVLFNRKQMTSQLVDYRIFRFS